MEFRYTSSPWGFRFYSFEKYCEFMKKIGISDICTMFGNPDQFPLALKPEKGELEKIKEIGKDFGINFLEISTGGNYDEEIELARILGVKYFRVCEIWEDNEDTFKEVVKKLKQAGQIAKEEGITVVVENHGGLTKEAKKCRELIEAVGMENVKINYDPANFLFYGEDPIKALDEILPFIGFTHFKSVKYENGKPKYCRLKEGVIDYKKLFEKLLPFYKGYIGLEYEEPSDVEQGTIDDLNYIKNLLKEGKNEH